MLKQAALGRAGFSYYNITTTRVIEELVPGNEYGELLRDKMIDFAATLGPPLIPMAYVINRLTASPSKLQRTINSSDDSPLCYEPVVFSIETKSPDGGSENGEVQLSLWAMAYFNRLRQLIQDPLIMEVVSTRGSAAVPERWKSHRSTAPHTSCSDSSHTPVTLLHLIAATLYVCQLVHRLTSLILIPPHERVFHGFGEVLFKIKNI